MVDHWLDGLKEDGLLVLPLTPDKGMGVIFGIRRHGERYFASVLSPVMIYPCAGARDPASAAALAEALKRGVSAASRACTVATRCRKKTAGCAARTGVWPWAENRPGYNWALPAPSLQSDISAIAGRLTRAVRPRCDRANPGLGPRGQLIDLWV